MEWQVKRFQKTRYPENESLNYSKDGEQVCRVPRIRFQCLFFQEQVQGKVRKTILSGAYYLFDRDHYPSSTSATRKSIQDVEISLVFHQMHREK